ncbi:MAG: YlmC/YmxH family sporulation protein [Clostridia bacterium]|jgi:YlmC/YmxH family sporulation protein|nr:YlmC/YmxH family sporulation protein [Clostridiales bacterium]
MRLSQIGGKEIVNLNTGERLGMVAEADLVIDKATGNIIRLLIPEERLGFSLFGERNFIEVPWENVKKIGNDMIIIEQDERKKRKGFLTVG